MEEKIPLLNGRIKEIIDYFDKGNVKLFARRLKTISQQRLNRIFNIDTRTLKYPSVPDDLLMSISNVLPTVDTDWLLTGNGTMLKNAPFTQTSGINMGNMQQTGHHGQNVAGVSEDVLDSIMKTQQNKIDVIIEQLKELPSQLKVKDEQIKTRDEQINKLHTMIEKLIAS